MAEPAAFRAQGNDAFKAGKFEEAKELYTRGIECYADGTCSDGALYNNRAACHLQLSNFELAASDANRALELDPNNTKAMVRIARAHANLGRTESAVAHMEKAIAIEPNNASYKEEKDAIQSGRATGAQQQKAGGFTIDGNDSLMYGLNLGTVALAVLHIVTLLFAPGISMMLWQAACGTFGARQLVGMLSTTGFPRLSMNLFADLTGSFHGQFLIVCMLFAIFPTAPAHLLLMAFCIYCFADLVQRFKPRLDSIVLMVPDIKGARQYMTEKVREVQRDSRQLMATAAMCEIMGSVMAPISGVGWTHVFGLLQFLKWRYQSEVMVKQTWGALHQQVTQLTHHERCPGFVRSGYQSFAALVNKMAARQ